MKLALFILALMLAGSGCTAPLISGVQPPQQSNGKINTASQELANGIHRFEFTIGKNASRLILYRFPKNGFSWHLKNSSTPYGVVGWTQGLPDTVFAVNAAYFNEKYEPTGLFIEDGKSIGTKEHEPTLSGVLQLAPTFRLVNTAKEKFDRTVALDAMQSYPFIISEGKPAIATDSGKLGRRTFIGTDTHDNRYIGIIPENEISLYELSHALDALDIPWTSVLNLDGGTSTGFYAQVGEFTEAMSSIVAVPSVILIEKL